MSSKHIVIGTAGHIDHGKTTLIKALTGIETDTTVEEQQRGLSINLGFAYLDLPNGERVGIVDVPGHERFVKNMLAGVAGISLVLLVIDANEGVMPQTKEHLDILTLLGITEFIVVLTKVGTVDMELRELVLEDIQEHLAKTVLEKSPIIETDALTGLGLKKLKTLIQQKVADNQPTFNESEPRLNIDRTFSVKGHGTIVTGTLIDGSLMVGDELEVYPSGKKTKIRSIQVHESPQEQAFAGQRTALNLTKLSLSEVKRGDVLTTKGNVEASWMVDVKASVLKSSNQELRLWDRVHVHIGTSEVLARIVPLGAECLQAGGEGFVQLRLEEQIAVKQGDRFILRSYSPMVTIAGGVVLEANAEKHRRYNEAILESLAVKESGDFSAVLLDYLDKQAAGFATAKRMAEYLNTNLAKINQSLVELCQQNQVLQVNQSYIARGKLQQIEKQMTLVLIDYHQKYSLRIGMSLEEFRSRFPHLKQKEIEAILTHLKEEETIITTQSFIKLTDFTMSLTTEQLAIKVRIETTLLEAGLMPPSINDILGEQIGASAVLETLVGDTVYYLNQETVIHLSVYEKGITEVREFFKEHESLTLGEFRDMMGTSRKYAKMFLEHLDDLKITKRIEDTRVLIN